MLSLDGYQNINKISQSDRSCCYRGQCSQSNQPVIIKTSASEFSKKSNIDRLRREYNIGSGLYHDSITRYLKMKDYQNRVALIIEDTGGVSLRDIIPGTGFEIREFLNLSLQLVKGLEVIHEQRIIHKNITSDNIIYHRSTQTIKIIDFGIAEILPTNQNQTSVLVQMEGTLAYISPEQTGRMSRGLDFRSDLYSLGVLFYQMICGCFPFQSDDPAGIIHAHLARIPISPANQKKNTPPVISEVIIKLLRKNPEERYQGCYGLRQDLEKCLLEITPDGSIPSFTLAKYDVSQTLQLSSRFFGRKKESKKLMEAFETVIRGDNQVVLVRGEAGVGKSAFVKQLKELWLNSSIFVSGKYDQGNLEIAYSAIVSSLQRFIRYLLSEPEKEVALWKKNIQSALGKNGQVIIDVIPELEHLIGPQPTAFQVDPISSKYRFNALFRRFFQVFTRQKIPLIIFSDDMQWSDSASLDLLENLISGINNCMFILTYRDNEIRAPHPFSVFLKQLKNQPVTVKDIHLTSLKKSEIAAFLADTLTCDKKEVKGLAEIIMEKTAGNPFFCREFLLSLHHSDILTYSNGGKWFWQANRIKVFKITDNVVELVTMKIKTLTRPTQELLKLAVCFGNRFNLREISSVSGLNLEKVRTVLNRVEKMGILERNKNGFQFAHDRFLEALYGLIPRTSRAEIHHNIGKGLLKIHGGDSVVEHVYEIANQLNRAKNRIILYDEKIQLAELNLKAGEKARHSNAFALAHDFFSSGMGILPEDSWDKAHQLTFELALRRAEAKFLIGEYDQANRSFDWILPFATDFIESARIYEQKITLNNFLMRNQQAVETLKNALFHFGIKIPDSREAIERSVKKEKEKLDQKLMDIDLGKLVSLPEMENQNVLTVISLIGEGMLGLYYFSPDLTGYCLMKSINLILSYGMTSKACKIFAAYGMILCGKYREYKMAFEFGNLSTELLKRYGNELIYSAPCFVCAVHIYHFRRHFDKNEEMLEKALYSSLECGERVYGDLSANLLLMSYITKGVNLDVYLKKYNDLIPILPKGGGHEIYLLLQRQSVLLLKSETFSTTTLSDDSFDEDLFLDKIVSKDNNNAMYQFYRTKAMTLYWFSEFESARQITEEAEKYQPLESHISVPEHQFYRSLIYTALGKNGNTTERSQYLKIIEKNRELFQLWSKNCPENYLHKYLLIEAELAGIIGKEEKAGFLYDQAIESAQENRFNQNQGIACELAGQFHLSHGRKTVACMYLSEAHRCYIKWGAEAKVKHLELKFRDCLKPDLPKETSLTASMDLLAITRATLSISSQIDLEKLMAETMMVIIENAGAEKGFLIQKKDNQQEIRASITSDSGKAKIHRTVLSENSVELSETIVRYVFRTGKNVVLHDTAQENSFFREPYIQSEKPKSILCCPVRRGKENNWVLYLENNLSSHVFTQDRIRLLEILAAQAAISLENAQLFDRQKQLAEQLTEMDRIKDAFLANTSHELKTPLAGIIGLTESLKERLGRTMCKEVRKDLQLITQSGNRLAGLINDILDFSRIRHHEVMLDIKPLSIRVIADLVLRHCQPLADQKHLLLVNRIPGSLPAVAADENRLQQIFFNLIGNAVKYTIQGQIEIKAEDFGTMVKIDIIDTGIGIPKEQQETIFKVFETGNCSGQSTSGGTGLGLSLAQKLVELHCGELTVQSSPGQGSCFSFTLPVHTDVPGPVQKMDLPSVLPILFDDVDPVPSIKTGQIHILIVDDDPVILRVLEGYLSHQQYSVSVSLSGTEALELIETNPDIQMLLLDVMMPEMNGYEVCERLRSCYSQSDLPIILLTARSQPEDIVTGLKAGANDYLTKPVNREELLARIQTQLKLKESIRRLKENEHLRQEIERREQAEQNLLFSQRRLIRILDMAEEAVVSFNNQGMVTFTNQKAEKILGYKLLGIQQLSLSQIFPELTSGDFFDMKTQGQEFQLAVRSGNGDTFQANVVVLKLDSKEETGTVFCISPRIENRVKTAEIHFNKVSASSTAGQSDSKLELLNTYIRGIEELLTKGNPNLIREIRTLPSSTDHINLPLKRLDIDTELKQLLVEVMSYSLRYWQQTTGKTRVDLAEESGIWTASINYYGTYITRTLDRYLNVNRLPQKPRWRNVLQTAYFTLQHCPDIAPELKTILEQQTAALESLLQISSS